MENSIIARQEIIRQKTLEWYRKGLELFPQEELPVEISFNLVGTISGRACRRKFGNKHAIQYNWTLADENWERFTTVTIPHEVAHIIADEFFKEMWPDGCDHSTLWEFVMVKFGIKNPSKYHTYDVSKVSVTGSTGKKMAVL